MREKIIYIFIPSSFLDTTYIFITHKQGTTASEKRWGRERGGGGGGEEERRGVEEEGMEREGEEEGRGGEGRGGEGRERKGEGRGRGRLGNKTTFGL